MTNMHATIAEFTQYLAETIWLPVLPQMVREEELP